VRIEFENKQKFIDNNVKSIDLKSDKDSIWELKALIRDLAHKDSIKDVEDKLFPLMKNLICKVESFDEILRENKVSIYRMDELILDKANKYDVMKITKLLNKTVHCDEFYSFLDKQDRINAVLNERSKSLINEISVNKTLCEFINEQVNKFIKEVNVIADKQSQNVNIDQLNSVRELINMKADHIDLRQLYELKVNKDDLATITNTMDFMHKQLN